MLRRLTHEASRSTTGAAYHTERVCANEVPRVPSRSASSGAALRDARQKVAPRTAAGAHPPKVRWPAHRQVTEWRASVCPRAVTRGPHTSRSAPIPPTCVLYFRCSWCLRLRSLRATAAKPPLPACRAPPGGAQIDRPGRDRRLRSAPPRFSNVSVNERAAMAARIRIGSLPISTSGDQFFELFSAYGEAIGAAAAVDRTRPRRRVSDSSGWPTMRLRTWQSGHSTSAL